MGECYCVSTTEEEIRAKADKEDVKVPRAGEMLPRLLSLEVVSQRRLFRQRRYPLLDEFSEPFQKSTSQMMRT